MPKNIFIFLTLILSSQYSLAQTSADKKNMESRNQHFQEDYQLACQIPSENYNFYPSNPEQAAQLEVTLDKGFSHQFTATSNEHYLQIATINWDEKLIVMINDNASIYIQGADINGEKIDNYSCIEQGRKIYHINTHEWASYLMKITTKTNEKIWLTVLPESNQ